MKFSIIILSYNTAGITINCLNSVFQNIKGDFEVIVVDNASSDGSRQKLKDAFGDKIKLIVNPKNIGFGAANNIGAAEATGEYLFFLNSDTILFNDVLSGINGVFMKESKAGAVAPRLILDDGTDQPDAYGIVPGINSLVSNKLQASGKETTATVNIDWVSGAALAVKKEVFISVGGFDENFFMYFEDIDLCWRIKMAGYKIIRKDDLQLVHLGGKSSSSMKSVKDLYYKSQDYFFLKHYGYLSMVIMKILRLPVRIKNRQKFRP